MKSFIPLVILTNILGAVTLPHSGRYEIENNTIYENAVGIAMSRAYTEPITAVVKNGDNLELEMSFNNTQYMGEFTITVNGKVVEHETILHDDETNMKTISFPVNSLQDDLTVGMYVAPMSRDVEYGVEFFEDTLILIEEYPEPEIESSSALLIGVGVIAIGAAGFFVMGNKKGIKKGK
ncbi:MAG: hypothetical protein BEN18_05620 [Epulopiscium sp. Nuni2H_MBin001]|nr:MAG: hypothetical protein BEN18_05620 [Epulopiscium sp. Nuni2H_MBin001]